MIIPFVGFKIYSCKNIIYNRQNIFVLSWIPAVSCCWKHSLSLSRSLSLSLSLSLSHDLFKPVYVSLIVRNRIVNVACIYISPTMKVKINRSLIFWYLSYLYTPYMMVYRGWQSQKHIHVPVQKWESSVTSELQMQKQAVINLHLVCMLISIPLACWFYLLVVLADFMLALFADLHACWYICVFCLLILCLMICMLAGFMLAVIYVCIAC